MNANEIAIKEYVNEKVAHEECETVFVSHEENPTAAAANKETALIQNELVMKDIMNNNEYWIGDTGATTHMTNNSEGIYNCAYPTESTQVVMGNGTKVNKEKIGTLIGQISSKNGTGEKIELQSVVVSSQAKFNFLSLTALMKVGWQMQGDANKLTLTRGRKQLVFDHKVKTPKGMLFVIKIKRATSQELATPSIDGTENESKQQQHQNKRRSKNNQKRQPQKFKKNMKRMNREGSKEIRRISRTTAHGIFGHINNDSVSESCAYLGYKIMRGSMDPCNHCREAKAQKEPITKISNRQPSTEPNELMFMDSATIKKPRKCTTI